MIKDTILQLKNKYIEKTGKEPQFVYMAPTTAVVLKLELFKEAGWAIRAHYNEIDGMTIVPDPYCDPKIVYVVVERLWRPISESDLIGE